MSCLCKYKYNIICGLCKLPFKESTTKEERIAELQKIINHNRIEIMCHKLEIREIQNEILDIDDEIEINRVVK